MPIKSFSSRLQKIKKIIARQKIDHFILPNSDEFFLEYLPENEKRVEYVSGFTGSNATIIIGQDKCHFFTDGRYTLQAKQELNARDYEVLNIATTPLFTWLQANLKKSKVIAIDAKLFSINFVRALQKIVGECGAKLVFIDSNPVDEIWSERIKSLSSEIFFHDLFYSGEDSECKRKKIIDTLDADAILFNRPESVCWLLNIRASDIEFTPLLAAYAILFKDGKVDLFVDENRLDKKTKAKLKSVNFIQSSSIELRISTLCKQLKKIQIDPVATNFWLYKVISNKMQVIEKPDPAMFLKACKNKTEIAGAIKAHEIDGLAVTKFLYWIEKNQGKIDELEAEKKLLELRQQNSNFLYPSFRSISSFAANGAVIHYHSSAKTNKKISGNSLYLIDSGGQYPQGTTDITRTVAIGKPSKEMIDDFTLVLQGHIALATVKFPQGTTGAQLDVLARAPLWSVGKDYDHGTGHGVGSFLSVHEGPCSISKRGNSELMAGMILSNEPGFYKENHYGIRIENLILVEKTDNNCLLGFRTLTLAPLDPNLINFKLLSLKEKIWLKNYHKNIFSIYKKTLSAHEKAWLERIKNIFKKAVDKEEIKLFNLRPFRSLVTK